MGPYEAGDTCDNDQMQPSISIAIPAYNAAATLPETIASIRAQTYADWEAVICDDGSTDGTSELVDRLSAEDARIRAIHQANRGSGGAYNTAVRAARAAVIVMLSADDLLLPEHLQSVADAVAGHPECAVFTCEGFYEYPDGRRDPVRANAGWARRDGCSLEELLRGSLFGVGAAFRREVFDAVGGFREDTYAEDYGFWLNALALGFTHFHIDTPLSVHRRGPLQKSSNALATRRSDAQVISDLLASGRLSTAEAAAARASLARLKRNIVIRRTMAALLGAGRAEQLIATLRGRR